MQERASPELRAALEEMRGDSVVGPVAQLPVRHAVALAPLESPPFPRYLCLR